DFKRRMARWRQVEKLDPADVEAHGKVKDLAASETIARGRYQHALRGGEDGEANGPAPRDETPVVPRNTAVELPAGGDRVSREAAPLLARIKAEPNNPQFYLRLAALYRRADRPAGARTGLEGGARRSRQHLAPGAALRA